MNTFGVFKESTDVADINKENKPEISPEAQDKFDQLMGDKNLSEAKDIQEKEPISDSDPSFLMDKFESLFNDNAASVPDNVENRETEKADADDKISQSHEFNSEFKIDDDTYETDDIGNIYKKNGALLPNAEYIVNGNTYRTDENGNKISCDAIPKLSEDGKRNISEQRESGGEDRKEGDQGGHIVARILGGAEGEENLIPMRGTINQGDYKKMELEIKKALEENKPVSIHFDIKYEENSSRPSKIFATYTIDDKKTEVLFDNEENSTELIDTLDEKIFDDDLAQLKKEIEDMNNDGCPASITSVKAEFDEFGDATKITVGVLDESTGTKSYKVFDAR